jgi:Holliday junction resolvase RusA-like endonuclease
MKVEGKELMFLTAFYAKKAVQAGEHKLFAGPFSSTIAYFMIPKNECDVSNCEKALLDAIQGIVYVNDKQNGRNLIDDPYWSNQGIYYSFTCRKFVGACIPHIDVTITYY